MFVGRMNELDILSEKYNSDKAELVVIYGRRRIGKTALIREFLKGKPHIFYSAVQVTDAIQLEKASAIVTDYYSEKIYSHKFSDWENLFQFIGDHASPDKKMVVAIDEFPYMAQGNSGVSSMLQKQWDLNMSGKQIMLILCGSSMSFMENEVLGEKNPLYGRTTGIIRMTELDFENARAFMGKGDLKEHLGYYSVFSGVPYYLSLIDPAKTFRDNLIVQVFRDSSVLFNETEFLLKQELREVTQYNGIIESIAHGDTRLNDIYQKTGIERSKLPYYLGNLMDLGIVRREFPADMKPKERAKSRSGLYRIDNSFFRFYYGFVYPYMSALLEGAEELIVDEVVLPRINEFVSHEFENIAIKQIRAWSNGNSLPIRPVTVGRWWNKDCEIDILAEDLKGNMMFGECKWRNEKTDITVLENLMEKTIRFNIPEEKKYYVLFSKSGFTNAVLERAKVMERLILCDYSGEKVAIV